MMNIFEKTRELNLKTDTYVVVAGGVLVALGLLKWDEDIDITVSPAIFSSFQQAGWREEQWQNKTVLKHDVYDVGMGFGDWKLEDLQADAMRIQNIPFMSLPKLLEWKQQMGREKDLRHIALIEEYLHNNS